MTTSITCSKERILIALDGSMPSDWAAQVGQQVAEELRGCVRLLHVVEPTIPVYEDFAAAKEIAQRREDYGVGILRRAHRFFPQAMAVDTVLRSGRACEEIAAEAREWKATLIVVGTHGHNRLADRLLGSTAESVLRTAPCPVIVVGHQPRWTAADAHSVIAAGMHHTALKEVAS